MVVVVFGHEKRQVDEPHGRAETRVAGHAFEIRNRDPPECGDKRPAVSRKPIDQYRERMLIVISLSRGSVGKIRGGQFCPPLQKVFHAREPDRLQIGEVAEFFCGAPAGLGDPRC